MQLLSHTPYIVVIDVATLSKFPYVALLFRSWPHWRAINPYIGTALGVIPTPPLFILRNKRPFTLNQFKMSEIVYRNIYYYWTLFVLKAMEYFRESMKAFTVFRKDSKIMSQSCLKWKLWITKPLLEIRNSPGALQGLLIWGLIWVKPKLIPKCH